MKRLYFILIGRGIEEGVTDRYCDEALYRYWVLSPQCPTSDFCRP